MEQSPEKNKLITDHKIEEIIKDETVEEADVKQSGRRQDAEDDKVLRDEKIGGGVSDAELGL